MLGTLEKKLSILNNFIMYVISHYISRLWASYAFEFVVGD